MTVKDAAGIPDRRESRRAFARAAAGYDAVAVLQREIGARLLERLDYIRIAPARVLDLGCGTGMCTRALSARYTDAQSMGVDIAREMIAEAIRQDSPARPLQWLCADIERLPFADATCDLLFSNLAFQWCPDPDTLFAGLARVLRPGGLLLFSTFGPDTLKELRASFAQADDGHTHVNRFIDLHDIGDALLNAGFADPVTDCERLTVTYPGPRALMHELKRLGAHNVTRGRSHALTGRARMQRVTAAYEALATDGRIPATFEVVYGHAWGAQRGFEVPEAMLR